MGGLTSDSRKFSPIFPKGFKCQNRNKKQGHLGQPSARTHIAKSPAMLKKHGLLQRGSNHHTSCSCISTGSSHAKSCLCILNRNAIVRLPENISEKPNSSKTCHSMTPKKLQQYRRSFFAWHALRMLVETYSGSVALL